MSAADCRGRDRPCGRDPCCRCSRRHCPRTAGRTVSSSPGRGLHEVLRDVHHALVEFAHQRVIGEIMEHPGGGEGAEAVVAVEGNHVGHAVLHETRAQVGLRIRRVVDVDANVGVLFLELLCRLLEPVRGLGLELEEIERDLPAAGTVAAARRAHADRQRAHRRADAAEHASHGRTSHPCCELHSDSLVHFHFPSPMAPLPRLTVASVWNRPFHSHHPACLETV